MANPQTSGYTPVDNDVAEALSRINLSSYESRVLWFIFRKTYGWQKKADTISYTQFEKATGIKRRHIQRALASLETRHIIWAIHKGAGSLVEYGPQKNHLLWDGLFPIEVTAESNQLPLQVTDEAEVLPKEVIFPVEVTDEHKVAPQEVTHEAKVSPIQGQSIPEKVTEVAPVEVTTKESNKLLQKKSLCQDFAESLKNYILQNNPKAKTPEDLTKWAKEFEHMINIDKRSSEDITAVIEFSQKDSFWCTNILSAGKLREKFDQLYLKSKGTGNGPSPGGKKYGSTSPGQIKQPKGTADPVKYIDGDAEEP